MANRAADGWRERTERFRGGAAQSKSVEGACRANVSVEQAIANLVSPTQQCAALTRHGGRVIREHDGCPAQACVARNRGRNGRRECVQMEDVRPLFIEHLSETPPSEVVPATVEDLQVGRPGG